MEVSSDKHLFLLTGPTAVGKTALSLQLAKDLNAEIISCDSLLFYKGMDIGTAKPSADELAAITHYGIDLCEVSRPFNVVEFRDYALQVAEKIYEKRKNVLVVGGSGFYFQSFLQPIADRVEIPNTIKEEVENFYEAEGLEKIVEKLKKLNPEGLGRLDLQNPRRVLPALERCLATKKTIEQLRKEFSELPDLWATWEKKVIRLERSREELHKRARLRVENMLMLGLVKEVKSLLKKGILKNPSAAKAIGYREVIQFLENQSDDLTALTEEITTNTRKLIRKQNTWFNHQLPSHHLLDMSTFSQKDYEILLEDLQQ